MKKNGRHCWSCEYYQIDSKCELNGLVKSKNGTCRKHKLVSNLRGLNLKTT